MFTLSYLDLKDTMFSNKVSYILHLLGAKVKLAMLKRRITAALLGSLELIFWKAKATFRKVFRLVMLALFEYK